MDDDPPRRAVLLVAAAALLWSSGGLFIKLAPMPGLAVACGRAIVATLFYLAVLRPDLRKARFSTALAYAGCVVTFVTATKLTTAAGQLAGNLIATLSGVFFALTVLLIRRDAKSGSGDAMPSTTLGNVLAALGTAPFAGDLLHVSATGVLVLLYLGVMQLGVSYWMFARGVRKVPAAEASLISMLEPVCNPLWVLLGTGERPGPWSIAGGAIVLGAVALRTLKT